MEKAHTIMDHNRLGQRSRLVASQLMALIVIVLLIAVVAFLALSVREVIPEIHPGGSETAVVYTSVSPTAHQGWGE